MKYLYIISGLLLVVGAALGITEHFVAHIVYLLGGAGYGLYYLLYSRQATELRTKRLVQMNIFASSMFVFSAAARLGALDRYGSQLWIVLLLLGLIFMIYANVVIGHTSRSDKTK